ncbi:MAG: beta-glucosidase family protein [Candidatus Limnocylindrales bacterium]
MSVSGPADAYRAKVEAAVESAIGKLDLDTKVRLLTGFDLWATHAAAQIGLRPVIVSDGPAGVKGGSIGHDETTTSLPSPTALAATWDEALVREIGELLAGEARRKGVDVLLGPTINLHRSPVGGRHFEQFSEDPLLTGRIAAAYVEGLQSCGVGACPKHYVCNESETERQTLTVDVAERPLRELYMAPFERTVREAGAWTVMAAYNGVRGTPMTESDLLANPLKGAWGFDGLVMSDWYATHSTLAACRAALDLVMPGPDGPWGEALVAAVRAGDVGEAAIDDKVRRLLRLAARVGALEGVPAATPVAVRPPEAVVSALVRRASAAGSVLLSNDGILPLVAGELRRLAVLGPNAALPPGQGGGSANLRPDYAVTPIEGLRAALPGIEILTNPADRVRPGLQLVTEAEVLLPGEAGAEEGAPGVLVRVLDENGAGRVISPTASLAGEIGRETARQVRLDGRLIWSGDPAIAGRPILEISARIVSAVSGKHRLGLAARGHTAIWIDGLLAVEEGAPPETIDIDAIWGEPPSHVAEVEMTAGQPVEFLARWRKFFDQPVAFLSLALEKPNQAPAMAIAESERLAREADAVILLVGTTEQEESEGRDRRSLALRPAQDELVRRVAAANPRTVVVVSSGAPVLMPWRDEAAAILLTWFPGQEAGHALADILLGRVEPGGRLPTTWPAETGDVPILDTQPVDGWLHYDEGLDIGYRAWLRAETAPAFPFGHGHGYTNWSYLDIEPATADGGGLAVNVRLHNSGSRPGREIVQLYLARPDSSVERPLLWLGGYTSVEAGAGRAVEVVVPIDPWALRHWDEAAGDWAVEAGRFEVRVGRSIGDLRLASVIEVEG